MSGHQMAGARWSALMEGTGEGWIREVFWGGVGLTPTAPLAVTREGPQSASPRLSPVCASPPAPCPRACLSDVACHVLCPKDSLTGLLAPELRPPLCRCALPKAQPGLVTVPCVRLPVASTCLGRSPEGLTASPAPPPPPAWVILQSH